MLSAARSRAIRHLSRRAQASTRRAYSSSANEQKDISRATQNQDATLEENMDSSEKLRVMQAPNRAGIWSRSQNPRAQAMSGPRFEQALMEYQPASEAPIVLVHKEPVRWTHDRVVACDGGGGPLGHPRIFINTDKPQICVCTYCGLPFANEHHRKHLESQPSTSYPLGPQETTAQVSSS